MPCNCEHMEPTYQELRSKEICSHICYLFPNLSIPVPEWVKKAAFAFYGDPERVDEAEQMLLNALKSLPPKHKDRFVYNGKSSKARKLADWFESRGKVLEEESASIRKKRQLKRNAEKILSRLRKEEVEILESYYKNGTNTGASK